MLLFWRFLCPYLALYCPSPVLIKIALTQWDWDKMAGSLQTTNSYTLSCLKIVSFWFEFHGFYLKDSIGNMPTSFQMMDCKSIIWNNEGPIHWRISHYNDVIMGSMTSLITSLKIVYSTVYSGADRRKHQSSASLAFVRGIHRWPVNSPHIGPVTRKMFPFDDVIMAVFHINQSKFV